MPSEPFSPPPPSGLAWTDEGAPRSERFGDVYFSADDGLAESRAVFLAGCGLPDAWAGRSAFTVVELGFGTGLNIIALIDLWHRSRPANGRLHVFSIEAYPLTREDAARALAAWPELADIAAALLAVWPRSTPGFHRIDLPDYGVVIDLAVSDVVWALDQWAGQADAWFLDGFSPALNSAMWSDAVLDGVAARSAPGARLATFTVAGAIRRGLTERGFTVEKRPGHGRKRERLEARLNGDRPTPARPKTAAIIGAGIAGTSVCRALREQGLQVTVIEADGPGAGASGFRSALVTPRLDAGDLGIAGLYAQALERASALYHQVSGAVLGHGVLQLEQTARDARRFTAIAAQPLWPEGEMGALDHDHAGAVAGEPIASGALSMRGALTVQPEPVLKDWLAGADLVSGSVACIRATDTGWAVINLAGQVLAEAEVVVIAAGWGLAVLAPDLNLAPVRGQADWVSGVMSPAIAWGGYVAPTTDGLLFGATHQRGDTSVEVRDEDSRRNLETLAARLSQLAEGVAAAGSTNRRAAIRATTPDRLPVCGALADRPGLFVLGGLGSRGFCLAPLLGEHLAALICGTPSPLPRDLAGNLSPERPIVKSTPIAPPAHSDHA